MSQTGSTPAAPRPPSAEPSQPFSSVIRGRCAYCALVATGLLGAAVVFRFDPAAEGRGVYPPCLLHHFTGLWCPGCGGTRAMHHLLHGHVWTAVRFNAPLVLLGGPVACGLFVRYTLRVWAGTGGFGAPAVWKRSNLHVARALGVLVVAFALLRNVPCRPFSYLAPPAGLPDRPGSGRSGPARQTGARDLGPTRRSLG